MNTAALTIEILCRHNLKQETINFFNAEHWNAETESILMQHLHDLLSIIRPLGKALRLNFSAEVTDFIGAVCVINKQKNKSATNNPGLTVREIEVLRLIIQGYTNKEIAAKLFISFETVRSHRKKILAKTGVKNTALLINCYHENIFAKSK
jgi:DNA-binding CsgD family transcriptional regulator